MKPGDLVRGLQPGDLVQTRAMAPFATSMTLYEGMPSDRNVYVGRLNAGQVGLVVATGSMTIGEVLILCTEGYGWALMSQLVIL